MCKQSEAKERAAGVGRWKQKWTDRLRACDRARGAARRGREEKWGSAAAEARCLMTGDACAGDVRRQRAQHSKRDREEQTTEQ